MLKYVYVGEINENEELPYWNNTLGWVFDFDQATTYSSQILDGIPPVGGGVGFMEINEPLNFYPV